jgi:glycosyltransferase involved in cell wall biosynthesis
MPAYNAARYLPEAVGSILSQTFEDFELLVVNDGSTDGTPGILASYDDSRMKVIHQENQGVIGALNTGLHHAKGKYIARMDSDDIAFADRFGEQVNFLDNRPDVAVVGTFAYRIDENGKVGSEFRLPVSPPELKRYLSHRSPLIHPSVMFRSEILEKVNGYPNVPHVEDYAFWIEVSRHFDMANLPRFLLYYRTHGEKISVRKNSVQIKNHLEVKRKYWNSIGPIPIERKKWKSDHHSFMDEERSLIETETEKQRLPGDVERARIFEANLAYGCHRNDLGARCLYELSILGSDKKWKWLELLARLIGFRSTWKMIRIGLRKSLKFESSRHMFEWKG